jgi:hypothetical protein
MSQPIVEKEAGPPKIPDDQSPDDGEKRKREYKDFGHDDAPKATSAYFSQPTFRLFLPLSGSYLRRPCRYVKGTAYPPPLSEIF